MNSNSHQKNDLSLTAKIGLLHSLSGTMAISEQPLLDAEYMAIDEINEAGGILGHIIKPVIVDGASDPEVFATKAKELIESGIDTIFGCWTSASRKAVKAVVETTQSMLWYPIHYEGFEESRFICYTGECINQQIIPALKWAITNIGNRVFLIGSDYIFPRTANFLARSYIEDMNGETVEEKYVPLGYSAFKEVTQDILRLHPSFVFNTLNGNSNIGFYKHLSRSGISSARIPVLATSVGERELENITAIASGHYVCSSYFQSIESDENKQFITRFKTKYGEKNVVTSSMVTAWIQIHLWKLAVEKAGSFDLKDVRNAVPGCSMNSPMGEVSIEKNMHMRKPVRIGRLNSNGQFDLVWENKESVKPLPWLGLEETDFAGKNMVMKSLSAFTDNLNYSIRLEREISERKLAENLLKKSETQLKALNHTKDKLFSIIAHDLRSPFNAILGLSELLLMQINDTGETDKEIVEEIFSTSNHLFRLLENLLDWSKNQTNQIKIHWEEVNVYGILENVVELMRPWAQKKGIPIVFPMPMEVITYTDWNMVSTILRNLLSNAIKYTRSGGTITLSIDPGKEAIKISVRVNGIGMSREVADALFKLDVTVSMTGTNHEKGAGLGLSICKEFVHKLGGEIWVNSQAGIGSTFSFTLPVKTIKSHE
jgi:urea ABC transporter urea binding protein